MEGTLLFYQGTFSGYKSVYGLIEDGCTEFNVFKKEAYIDQIFRFGLNASEERPSNFKKGKINFDDDDGTPKKAKIR
jgi:hypothetical protein